MTTVLKLQKLAAAVRLGENIVLASAFSGICPSNVGGDNERFEME